MIVETVSKALNMDEETLLSFAATCPHRYKTYEIPKRSGGSRTIAQPSRELKSLQRFVLRSHLSSLPIHSAAKAYRKGIGIGGNAVVHIANAFILKLDFQNFFPSIKPSDLVQHIEQTRSIELPNNDVKFVTGVFFYKEKRTGEIVLSIGAPSSPFISNTLMYDFDTRIESECKKTGVLYTRYADDLTFSTNEKGGLTTYPKLIANLLKELAYPRVALNTSKTIFLSKKGRREITGLIVTNEAQLSVGRSKKRHIRSLVYRYKLRKITTDQLKYLRGYLAFIQDVEPRFIESLASKYGHELISEIRMNPSS